MSLPIQVFGDHPQRLPGAIRLRGITWKLLVRQIWVIHKRAGRFHQIDSARTFALCQLRSPNSRVQRFAKVDPGRPSLRVVGGIAGLKQVPGLQVRPGAMVESSRGGIEDEWSCGIAHAYLVIYIVAIIPAGTTGKIHLVSLSCLYPSSDASSDTQPLASATRERRPPNGIEDQRPRARCNVPRMQSVDGKHSEGQSQPCSWFAASPWLGDRFILHHRNNPAPLSGDRCAQETALPTYCCRDDGRCHSSDCPPRRKRACLLKRHW